MNSTGEKIVAKVVVVLAVSGSVFVLTATSAAVSPAPAVALAEPQASPSVCEPPSMANCKEETMRDYLYYVRPMVEKFFGGKYNGTQKPPGYYFIDKDSKRQSKCRKKNNYPSVDPRVYEYCSADEGIYLGREFMWYLYDKVNHIVPAVVLAHEWGHHIQHMAGVREPQNKNDPKSVKYENQADCLAGAWIQYADQQGWFEGRGGDSITIIADKFRENNGGDLSHGTPEQRERAMLQGFNYGLGACNEYYPERHIIHD